MDNKANTDDAEGIQYDHEEARMYGDDDDDEHHQAAEEDDEEEDSNMIELTGIQRLSMTQNGSEGDRKEYKSSSSLSAAAVDSELGLSPPISAAAAVTNGNKNGVSSTQNNDHKDGPYDYPKRPIYRYAISKNIPAPPLYKRKVGRMYVCIERKHAPSHSQLVCMMGPCWPMFFVTFLLIAGISVAIFASFLPYLPVWVSIVSCALLFVVLISFTLTACSNPGIVERLKEPRDQLHIYDEIAQCYRPHTAMYDQESQVIIEDIDHFCPWTGTIIASNNMLYFQMFTSTLCVLIIVVIVVLIWGLASMTNATRGSHTI